MMNPTEGIKTTSTAGVRRVGWSGLVSWWERYRKRHAIRSIRKHMEWFGCDMSNVSDEQIRQATIETAKASANVGVTAKQAAEALTTLCNAMAKVKSLSQSS